MGIDKLRLVPATVIGSVAVGVVNGKSTLAELALASVVPVEVGMLVVAAAAALFSVESREVAASVRMLEKADVRVAARAVSVMLPTIAESFESSDACSAASGEVAAAGI